MPSQSLATLLPTPLATTLPTTSGKSDAAGVRAQGGAFAGWLSRLLQPAPATTSATQTQGQTQTQGWKQASTWTPARTAFADLDAVMPALASGPTATICQNGQARETTASRSTTTQRTSGKLGTARRDADAAGKARDRHQPATDVVPQEPLSADSIAPPVSGMAMATATTGQDIAGPAQADEATDVSPAAATQPAATVLSANSVALVSASDAGDAVVAVPPAMPGLADVPDNPPAPTGDHATATASEDAVAPSASAGTTVAAYPPTLSFSDTTALASVHGNSAEAGGAGTQAATSISEVPRAPVASTRSAAGQTARGSPPPSAAAADASAVARPYAAATESATATGAAAQSDAAGHAAQPRPANPDAAMAKPTGPSTGMADTRVLDDQPSNAGAPQTRLSSRSAPQLARDAAVSTTADADTAATAASATADPSPAQAAQTATALIAPAVDHTLRTDASASVSAGARSAADDPAGQLTPTLTRLAGAGGTRQLTVRLAPPELGSVTISVSHTPGGTIAVTLTAERPETLQALQRSQAQLDHALDAAGMAAHGREVTLHLAAVATPPPSAATQPSSTSSTSTTAMASTDNAWLGQTADGSQGDGHTSGQDGGGRRSAARGGSGAESPPLAATAGAASATTPAWSHSGIDITA